MFPRFESIGFVGIVVVYFHVSVRNVTSHKVLVNLTCRVLVLVIFGWLHMFGQVQLISKSLCPRKKGIKNCLITILVLEHCG